MGLIDKFRLEGKAGIVTGAARGLGKAYSEGLAEAGADLLLADMNVEQQEETAEELSDSTGREIVPTEVDVSSEDDVKRMVEEAGEAFGRIDFIINNAGIVAVEPALDVSLEDWRRVIDVNLTGVFLGSREVARYMIDNEIEGDIVNVSSGYGKLADLVPVSSYYASKAGVVNLSKGLAIEWGHEGIRVNVICPGWYPTPMNTDFYDNEKWRKHMGSKIALGRVGKYEDIVPVVVFMVSDASNYISGHAFEVTGGPIEVSEPVDTGIRFLEEMLGEEYLERFNFSKD